VYVPNAPDENLGREDMNRRISNALRVAFITLFPTTLLLALPQELAEKNKVQASTPEKSSGEQRVVERNFPSTAEPTFTPVELQPVSTPITLTVEGDARKVYEDIGQAAGVATLFDPDYVSRSIRVDLHRVPLREALQTVALESKTFWRPVTPHSIFVAADTLPKRRDFEQSVIKVFSLPNHATPMEVQEVTNALRVTLDITRVMPLAEGAVVVRGTPEQISLATRLIDDIGRARPKLNRYRVEVKVTEMDGQTKLNSRSYRLFVQPNEPQRLNIVVPPAQAESTAASDKDKAVQEPAFYQNIDCSVTSESEHAVGLTIKGTFSDHFGGEKRAQSGSGGDVRQFSIDAKPILSLDKPTTINSFDDPGSKHIIQVELAVTRLSETP
jgi:hypothetical protein